MHSSISPIYRHAFIYETAMRLLYGRGYAERYRVLAELIPDGATVLDVCCGPAVLFHRYLKAKRVVYTGVDINLRFVEKLAASGASGLVWDIADGKPLPRAQYVVMQASLYHFLPDAADVVQRLIIAAEKQVLIAEPIRNMADSENRMLSFLARKLTNPGTRQQPNRFNETSLDALLRPYQDHGQIVQSRLIAQGREKLYALAASPSFI